MDAFKDWLERVPSLALKELAGGGEAMRPLKKQQVMELVRADPELARESWRIETEAAERVAAMCPRLVRDTKIRYGLVD